MSPTSPSPCSSAVWPAEDWLLLWCGAAAVGSSAAGAAADSGLGTCGRTLPCCSWRQMGRCIGLLPAENGTDRCICCVLVLLVSPHGALDCSMLLWCAATAAGAGLGIAEQVAAGQTSGSVLRSVRLHMTTPAYRQCVAYRPRSSASRQWGTAAPTPSKGR
jgi:hypothetical protein